jgi:hypothetical protein
MIHLHQSSVQSQALDDAAHGHVPITSARGMVRSCNKRYSRLTILNASVEAYLR